MSPSIFGIDDSERRPDLQDQNTIFGARPRQVIGEAGDAGPVGEDDAVTQTTHDGDLVAQDKIAAQFAANSQEGTEGGTSPVVGVAHIGEEGEMGAVHEEGQCPDPPFGPEEGHPVFRGSHPDTIAGKRGKRQAPQGKECRRAPRKRSFTQRAPQNKISLRESIAEGGASGPPQGDHMVPCAGHLEKGPRVSPDHFLFKTA